MITADQGKEIVEAAKRWLGTPHINDARVRGIGVDCGMLLLGATEDAGLIPRDSVEVAPYSNEWHLHHSEEWFLQYIKTYCTRVDDADMQPGDFLLYQYGRCISHAGIYMGNDTVCHALIQQGVVLTGINDVMFFDAKGRSRLRGVYRYNGGSNDGPVRTGKDNGNTGE